MSAINKKPDAGPSSSSAYLTLDIEPDYARTGRYELLATGQRFIAWAKARALPVTAFVVGELFDRGHPLIDALAAAGIPVELHGYAHAQQDFGDAATDHRAEIEKAVKAYGRRMGRPPLGYRAPLGIIGKEDLTLLRDAGLYYDASIFPMRRRGRYDFRGLPGKPFRWAGLDLIELPFGLLTSRLPAGMTFINLLGRFGGARLVRRQCATHPFYVIDAHLHNFYAQPRSLRRLPLALQMVYLGGHVLGGLSLLDKLVRSLAAAGIRWGELNKDVPCLARESLPVVEPDICRR